MHESASVHQNIACGVANALQLDQYFLPSKAKASAGTSIGPIVMFTGQSMGIYEYQLILLYQDWFYLFMNFCQIYFVLSSSFKTGEFKF